ncbi:unnamed protein product [Cylindrotheca closterium]|uniref:Uncharacterized protein n=1 Tax=Cylindrotheca closterium TaxID=2856 RepID=A0AAD2FQC1_9STRA|nr:unnamed protein product [Cylindrotheca closterium]
MVNPQPPSSTTPSFGMDAVIANLQAIEKRRKQKRRQEKRDQKRRRQHKQESTTSNENDANRRSVETATMKKPKDSIPLMRTTNIRKRQRTEKKEDKGPSMSSATPLPATINTNDVGDNNAITTNTRERLPFGYFDGRTIFRNSLHPSEVVKDGFVTLAELVPPDCTRILATSFCAPQAFEWLDQTILGGPYGKYARPSHVLLVHHGEEEQMMMMKEIKVRRKKQENWYRLAYQPHTRGCMHPKVILFRCSQGGLRLVVSGNNFYQYQWENDRDCLWVQDFKEVTMTNDHCCYHHHGTKQEESHKMPLRSFLTDLCQGGSHQRFIKEHLEALFCNIDLEQSNASLVYSFPRLKNDAGERGGWKLLTEVVQDCLLDDYDTENDWNSPNTPEYHPSTSDTEKRKDRYVLYAMSGSIGNLDPTLLKCMKNAMTGKDTFFDDFPAMNDKKGMAQEWAKLAGIQCLLPSLETARKMDPTWNGRLMTKSHWNSIPRIAQQQLFADAIPNPNFERTETRPKHPFAHAKVLYCKYNKSTAMPQLSKPSILYVGSHNFSRAAWGHADRMPGNVEVGVVLSTCDPILEKEWESRLPYLLLPGSNNNKSDYYRPLLAGDWKEIPDTPNQMAVVMGDGDTLPPANELLFETQQLMSRTS